MRASGRRRSGGLVERLGEYEANRGRYPDLAAFYPRVVEFFDDFAQKRLESLPAKSLGPINHVFSDFRSRDGMPVVVSQGNFDKGNPGTWKVAP